MKSQGALSIHPAIVLNLIMSFVKILYILSSKKAPMNLVQTTLCLMKLVIHKF